jgi:hypothetical protein
MNLISGNDIPPRNFDKFDDAMLAMLSDCILTGKPRRRLGIQADPKFNYQSLQRLRAKGYLAAPPSILADRPIWLTPKGARRAQKLFRQMFCD